MNIGSLILILLLSLILFFGLYVLFYKKKRYSAKDLAVFQKLWKEAETQIDIHPEQAVMKADKILDHALKKAGYSGTLGEKLKKARAVFSDNNAVWTAHKLRNKIAHEVHVNVSQQDAKSALKSFKKALKDLGLSL